MRVCVLLISQTIVNITIHNMDFMNSTIDLPDSQRNVEESDIFAAIFTRLSARDLC